MRHRLTIVISGMVAGDPHQGGATWAVLQYVLGFRRLGYEVFLIEPVPVPLENPLEGSPQAAYFHRVAATFGLEQTAALVRTGTRDTCGLPFDRLREICRRADLLVNISGMLTDPELTDHIPLRVYL